MDATWETFRQLQLGTCYLNSTARSLKLRYYGILPGQIRIGLLKNQELQNGFTTDKKLRVGTKMNPRHDFV